MRWQFSNGFFLKADPERIRYGSIGNFPPVRRRVVVLRVGQGESVRAAVDGQQAIGLAEGIASGEHPAAFRKADDYELVAGHKLRVRCEPRSVVGATMPLSGRR